MPKSFRSAAQILFESKEITRQASLPELFAVSAQEIEKGELIIIHTELETAYALITEFSGNGDFLEETASHPSDHNILKIHGSHLLHKKQPHVAHQGA